MIYGLYRVIKTSVICLIYFTLTLIHPDHRSCRRPAVMLIDIKNKPRQRITMSKVGSLYPSLLDTFIAISLFYLYNKYINVIVYTTISCTSRYKICKQNDWQVFTADTNI